MNKAAYRNPDLPVEERVADLLKRMSPEEKIGQMTDLRGYEQFRRRGDVVEITEEFKRIFGQTQIGSLTAFCRADWYSCRNWENGLTPALAGKAVNLFQRYVIENSRWGIPLWIGEPTVHGLLVLGGTMFPSVTALGATWNSALIERIFAVAAKEADAIRVHRGCLSLDIARDPRWSRVEECFGEDPYLVSQLGVASTYGLQGRKFPEKGKVVAVMRHFGGHGDPEGGHNQAPAHLGPIEAHNAQFKPFRECAKAGARGVMSSYNTIDGSSCTGDRHLLTDILRKQWGFKGYVVPDAGAIPKLKWDRFAGSDAEACAMAVKAGVDKDLWNPDFFIPAMREALDKGLLEMADIDEAASHLLRAKFEMGLFENPFAEEGKAVEILGCKEHREVALKAARESLVLLSNHSRLLPLSNVKRLAVIGPNADSPENQLGDYSAPQRRGDVITVLDGMKELGAKRGMEILYAKGCKVRSQNDDGFKEAIAVAAKAEAIVLVLGGSSAAGKEVEYLPTGAAKSAEIRRNCEHDKESGEGYDRASLRLAGRQLDLLDELKRTGKPLITVLIMGRPLIINKVMEQSDAVLLAWYPGVMGGQAIAEALSGEYNPGGKLPISFPRDEGQLPVYYNSHQPRANYIDMESRPLLPFGFGLSYTTFNYSDLKLDKSEISPDGVVNASIKVENSGLIDGDEVVQLYLTDKVSSVARPYRELRGFKRIHLKAGETQVVEMKLGAAELGLYNRDLAYAVEPGTFTVAIGGSLDSLLEAEFSVR